MLKAGVVIGPKLQQLYDMEDQAISASEDMADAATRFAWAVYQIIDNELWKAHTDEDGVCIFSTATEYLRDLDQRCLQSKSQMWEYVRGLRFARAYGYTTFDQVSETGVKIFKKLAKELPTDKRTNKAIGVSDRDILSAINDLAGKPGQSNSGLTPAEINTEIERRFKKDVPKVWFEESSDGSMQWLRRTWDEHGYEVLQVGQVRIELTDDPPFDVMEKLRRQLKRR